MNQYRDKYFATAHPDLETIVRLKSHDIDAFKLIYQKYFNQVFCFALKFSISKEDAEEITQDVFVRFWDKRASIDPDKKLSGFLYKITRNMVIDKLRQYSATRKNLQAYISVATFTKPVFNSTEQSVNFYELSGILSKLIDKLPPRRRIVFKLSREKGYPNKEIASLLQISEGTVEKQLSSAMKSLKQKLRESYSIEIDL